MPAFRLEARFCSIRQYDVAGLDSSAAPSFVTHVGLAASARDGVDEETPIGLIEMSPPMRESADPAPITCLGFAELEFNESEKIRVFCNECRHEYAALRARPLEQYCVHPHVIEPTRDDSCRRFSCAGFVIEAYRQANINLVDTQSRLPAVGIAELSLAYPGFADRLRHSALRERLGLTGDGPWPVVLAGYVINALDRGASAVRATPYSPVNGDGYFPPRRKSD